MITLFLGFIIMLFVMIGMSIGIIMGRHPIIGSCGGIATTFGESNYNCDICGDNLNKCDDQHS